MGFKKRKHLHIASENQVVKVCECNFHNEQHCVLVLALPLRHHGGTEEKAESSMESTSRFGFSKAITTCGDLTNHEPAACVTR